MQTETVKVRDVAIEVMPQMARRTETLRVGSKVKVLIKEAYQKDHKVHPGVVVGFEPFKELPTVVIAYADISWSDCNIRFLYLNENTKDAEVIAACDLDHGIDNGAAEKWFARQIEAKTREAADLAAKREFFRSHFGENWARITAESAAA
jgi:hypothetical protein